MDNMGNEQTPTPSIQLRGRWKNKGEGMSKGEEVTKAIDSRLKELISQPANTELTRVQHMATADGAKEIPTTKSYSKQDQE